MWDDGSIRWLIDDPGRDVDYAFVPPNGGPVVVVEIEHARIRATFLDPDTGEEIPPPSAPGNLVPLAPVGEAAGDADWVGLHYDARHPMDLVRLGPEGDPRSLTGLWERAPLGPEDLVAAEDFTWRSVDGLGLQGWLYRAPGPSKGTVVLVHGGPTSHAEDRFNAEIQYLVARGFDVLAPNYRGSTGFGLDVPGDDQGGRLGRPGAGGHQARHRGAHRGRRRRGRAGSASPAPPTAGTRRGGRSRTGPRTSSPPRRPSAA